MWSRPIERPSAVIERAERLWIMRTLGVGLALGLGLFLAAGCGSDEGTETQYEPLTPAPKQLGDPANQAVFAVDVSFWETPLAQSEMDCFWDSGVRHLIVGTQVEYITREQLAMAVSRGMTVDAYVYLYWDTDIAAQVKQAFQRVSGFPIGRMWLDIEQDAGGRGANQLIDAIAKSLAVCKAQGGVECGIYTSPGWWKTNVNDTTQFKNELLWWAHYDYKTSLSTWSKDAFGGWTQPVAKQWATQPLCGVGGADWNSMKVSATPTVSVDHSPAPDTGLPPAQPAGLWPPDGAQIPVEYAKVMSETVSGATLYEVATERWGGSTWIPYYTGKNPNAFVKFNPTKPNQYYRFRVRGKNTHGFGPWSEWSTFEYGDFAGPAPAASPPSGNDAGTPVTDAGTNPPDAAAPPGAPTNLSPDGNASVTSSPVTLSCSAVANATNYEFAIENQAGTSWTPYFTYAGTTATRSFYPQKHATTYRWRVRAKVAGAFGAWSNWATFTYP